MINDNFDLNIKTIYKILNWIRRRFAHFLKSYINWIRLVKSEDIALSALTNQCLLMNIIVKLGLKVLKIMKLVK